MLYLKAYCHKFDNMNECTNTIPTTLLQDFGEFTVATADIIRPAPDCNCINTGRWVDSRGLFVVLLKIRCQWAFALQIVS